MVCSYPGIASNPDCKNSLGMSIVSTSISYFALFTAMIKTLYVAAIRLLKYYWCIHALCIILLEKYLDLTIPYFFSVNNDKYLIVLWFYFLAIVYGSMGIWVQNLLAGASDSFLCMMCHNLSLQMLVLLSWD